MKKVAKGLVTPPPKKKSDKGDSTGSAGSGKKPKPKEGRKDQVERRLSFGSSTTTEIAAENPPGKNVYGKDDDLKKGKADEIFKALKKELIGEEPCQIIDAP